MITKEELYKECDSLPKGWHDMLYKMVDELYSEIVKSNLEKYCVLESKEKYGGLRWYDTYGNDTTDKIVLKYMNLSETICYFCGKSATKETKGFVVNVCDDCYNKWYNGTLYNL